MHTVAYSPGRPRGAFAAFRARTRPGYQRAMTDVHTGGVQPQPGWKRAFGLFQRPEATKGFALDLNRNGRYDRGRDGVLAFDFNKDGKYDQKDVHSTNNMMKAATGNFDFDGDGRTSFKEKIMGYKYKSQFGKLDRNRDGKLDTGEISRGGGRVWVDRNRDGQIGRGETHSAFRLPSPDGRGSVRLDKVSPRGWSKTSRNRPYFPGGHHGGHRPWPGHDIRPMPWHPGGGHHGGMQPLPWRPGMGGHHGGMQPLPWRPMPGGGHMHGGHMRPY